MEIDPEATAESIPAMIENDTLVEVLDQDHLCDCLKFITLNVDQALYILDKIQSKHKVLDRFQAIRHIFVDFGKGDKFNPTRFIEFTRSLGRCLHFDIIDYIVKIIESAFSKNDELTVQYNRILHRSSIGSQHLETEDIGIQAGNRNIEELKQIAKTDANFDEIYKICERIATEKDESAMSFAVKKKFIYVTEKDLFDRNIFTKAVYENNQDLIRIMIDSGIDINSKDNRNSTALIRASFDGHHEVVKLLLSVPGIDVNAKDDDHNTALIYASRKGYHEVVKLLLTVPGIDVNAGDKDDNTALIRASWEGHLEVVKLLLTVPGIDVNAETTSNRTALFWASREGHHEIVEMLKDHGAICEY